MKYRNNRGTILQIQFRTFLRYSAANLIPFES
uniref:Uncharacterized protein, isoform A n=1 Tax=Drosophila melanogaster TaxID=7227 RepID=A0A9F2H0X9_DROME|nr:uncharacterized protein Dmel_CG46523, isoform A [Drosophila melanogaster]NP_001401029.1 uncharacterized protein Dmel_CG46523, isoform B [Drosophila melanogaster]UYI58697.1 uncharacterized protein Dmel_CG46523, isoform A [Drosophila melanogaster]UYI58698.1 uncharacterized protein Dmel_CG46523, isoform B [Drosophila melanogaster]